MIARILIVNAFLTLSYMSLWFLVARRRKRLDTVDTAWGLGFVVLAWSVELQRPNTSSLVIALLVSVWGLRLSNHIWQRSQGRGDDPRYRELSSKWRGNFWLRAYVSIFLLQGALVWLISLPIVMAAGDKIPGLGWLTVTGVAIWLVGFVLESIADRQLANFLRLKDRPKVLQTGLWRYSRHPNYFGELIQWWAIAVVALQAGSGWFGLFGPLVLSVLIIFVSGIPPIERRRQKDAEYRHYKQRTSALVPLPPRHSN